MLGELYFHWCYHVLPPLVYLVVILPMKSLHSDTADSMAGGKSVPGEAKRQVHPPEGALPRPGVTPSRAPPPPTSPMPHAPCPQASVQTSQAPLSGTEAAARPTRHSPRTVLLPLTI
ncbi:unnamed protein product [Nesidiocoris tenuis]|uniref:Uncharacterized protein n=1 Tax=Nesidiocoris tenuis TaxID=355587 RepID=A0A6H5H6Z3_9HEMI|nr:unnamed protein product [Nesidiocoris tenuis]